MTEASSQVFGQERTDCYIRARAELCKLVAGYKKKVNLLEIALLLGWKFILSEDITITV